jgi:hypothetical protein
MSTAGLPGQAAHLGSRSARLPARVWKTNASISMPAPCDHPGDKGSRDSRLLGEATRQREHAGADHRPDDHRGHRGEGELLRRRCSRARVSAGHLTSHSAAASAEFDLLDVNPVMP